MSKTNKHYEQVCEFMRAGGQEVLTEFKEPTTKLALLRLGLIKEEIKELDEHGFKQDDVIEIADALGDILVVTYGAFAAFGMEPFVTFPTPKPYGQGIKPIVPTYRYATQTVMAFEDCLYSLDKSLQDANYNHSISLLSQIIEIAYSTAFELGMNINAVMEAIHVSNMSKFATCYGDAKDSIPTLVSKGKLEDNNAGEVRKINDNLYAVIRKKDGKILKCDCFQEPDIKTALGI